MAGISKSKYPRLNSISQFQFPDIWTFQYQATKLKSINTWQICKLINSVMLPQKRFCCSQNIFKEMTLHLDLAATLFLSSSVQCKTVLCQITIHWWKWMSLMQLYFIPEACTKIALSYQIKRKEKWIKDMWCLWKRAQCMTGWITDPLTVRSLYQLISSSMTSFMFRFL